MNTVSNFGFKRPIWQSIVMLTLGFWLSASLLLDWVIMPSLYVSGMITQASFATAGYVIFWNFNRIELLAAGLVLTGVLALNQTQSKWRSGSLILSVLLLAISLTTTYFLTPEMSAVGMQLNLFQTTAEVPANMNLLHGSYWLLEVIKLVAGGTLLSWCWRQ
ncbi:hypothetical protein ACE1AT_18710 [Pelatocladus sp. BLCC-F211]|uniref:hypothetical protein n=1 Tax=Pelatocladus sp. BLCC-F211 TaxID=3342752 RepID=UPI0035B97F99